MMNKIKEIRKNKKGGLSQLLSVVLLLIITVFIFISAIHPNGQSVRKVGDDSNNNIVKEQTQIMDEFQPSVIK
ncbi:hypothetical protein FDC45_17950 [Clostridium botulinum]|uniref:Uncharacterized protein n=1 Tax=Clostridium botulinum TaxID=1491 RepID=A0A846J807_CLOBO|nr:hypothetical protein [Clostridium botulinum]ACA57366.1 hypothetical protein CLK_A0277 [Clostridium botulinum A3 str. Loch Maree]NFH67052.1 hypothetical protein [Clostridium botulinum]NFJ09642.1 hypothetical protein [Clostridium botulinum]NFK16611.1 hypothetical protein [Clostridium botulinum]NFM94336.1 hypothetical protein [Clostridium botulinum]